jgi:ribonucleotide monophosphatase NagD (HAD superfamily)
MIGASLHDVEAGNRAGCRTLLIDNGSETEWRLGPRRVPTRIVPDLYAAALMIASEGETRR